MPKYTRAAEAAAAAWLATGLYACLIFTLSAVPHFPVPKQLQIIHGDWIFHMLEYSFFGFLLVRAFGLSFEFPSTGRLMLAAFLAGVFYATTDEFHQKFVPGRTSCLSDGVADAIGLACGIQIWVHRTRE